tara:strand:+ start:992 stop:1129 length:138 start_codon:yes stop_codon:yes gene_type:complete
MNTQKEKQLLVEVTPPGEDIENNILDEKPIKKQNTEIEDQSQDEQ